MNQGFPDEIAKYLTTDPPEALYHYTSQAGLLGIVQAGAFWATKIQYMNDSTEFARSLRLARDELTNIISKIAPGDVATPERIIYHELLRTLEGLEDIHIFAVCFCEEGDLLGQWRGYTGGHQGYSIGFSTAALTVITESKDFLLGKCIYDTEIQKGIVRSAIDTCFRKIKSDGALGGGHGPLADILFRCGALFKDPSFKEEKEWRLISPRVYFHDDNLCFRTGDSMIAPYYDLGIKTDDRLPILHVFVGPCPHMKLSCQSVTALLMKNGLRSPLHGVPVTFPSQIPFRNW
jgi:hypothetical protein